MTTRARDLVGGFPVGSPAEFLLSGLAPRLFRGCRLFFLAARPCRLAASSRACLTWPHGLAGPGKHGPAGTDQGVSTCHCTDTRPRTGGQELTHVTHLWPANRDCSTSYARIKSLGVHRKVYFRRVLRIHCRRGAPLSAGARIGICISWRCGITAGSRTRPNGLPILRTVPGPRPGNPAGGSPHASRRRSRLGAAERASREPDGPWLASSSPYVASSSRWRSTRHAYHGKRLVREI
jgi:hypothetical protein